MLQHWMSYCEMTPAKPSQGAPRTVSASKIINVASVPHRSPFRYAGGKTWLIPHIRGWLSRRSVVAGTLLEPFAGGGTVGLTAIFEGLAERAVLVEIDEQVAAVWQTMLGDA